MKSVRLLCTLLLLPLAVVAGPANQNPLINLRAGRYADVEQLYNEKAAAPMTIEDEPEIHWFFDTLELKKTDSDEEWEKRRALLEQWHAEQPDSKAALLALAAFYNDYGFKARGTGWAREVSEEAWKLFRERRAKAVELLESGKARLEGEIMYHYILAYAHAPATKTFEVTRREVAVLNEKWPQYYPGYSLMANYLLLRWGGRDGELEAYARRSADALGGDEGDFLYARLLSWPAYIDKEEFVRGYHPDAARITHGFEYALKRIQKPATRAYLQGEYANTCAQLGDWRRTREILLKIGRPGSFYYWDGRENYLAHLEKSGARGDIIAAGLLESRGKLAEAEAAYRSFEPDAGLNTWLMGFYLRHAMVKQYEESPGAEDLHRPIADLSLNDTYTMAVTYATLGWVDQAREAAEKFDRARGHNITGKLVIYELALRAKNPEAIRAAHETITGLKTNRASYKLAQAVMRGERTVDPHGDDGLDWNDRFVFQAATAIALWYYEQGRIDDARALLTVAVECCMDVNQREWMNALMLRPPVAAD
jgi:hypothetical protein